MSAALALAALACACAWARVALGEGAPCPEGCDEFAWLDEAPDGGLYAAQREEWLLSLSSLNSWNPETAHYDRGFGAGIEVAFPFDASRRARLGVHNGVLVGAWGGDDYPPVSLAPGLRLRYSPFLYDEYDLYLLGKLDSAIGLDRDLHVALRPGLGGGVRIARTLSLEFAFEPPLALGDEFRDGNTRSRWLVGFWTSGAFDLCILGRQCRESEPRPRTVETTCALYGRARRTCQTFAARHDSHERLCLAVEAALDADLHPTRQNEDATTAFLVALDAELRSAELSDETRQELLSRVQELLETHASHRSELAQYRASAREAAAAGRELACEVRYAPWVVELARALGCYRAELGDCPDVCED